MKKVVALLSVLLTAGFAAQVHADPVTQKISEDIHVTEQAWTSSINWARPAGVNPVWPDTSDTQPYAKISWSNDAAWVDVLMRDPTTDYDAGVFSAYGRTRGYSSNPVPGPLDGKPFLSESFYSIVFDVNVATAYTFSGFVHSSLSDSMVDGGNFAKIAFTGADGFSYVYDTTVDGNFDFNETFALNPGQYSLIAFANTDFLGGRLGDRASEFQFNLAPVPEPGTWALLLAGLGLMGFVARRRNRPEDASGLLAA